MMYTDLSDCKTPFLRSNVAESVTVFDWPDASVGSLYSTWRMSPCRIHPLSSSVSAESPSSALGQSELLGPSLYCMVTDDSKIPASGAISSIGFDVSPMVATGYGY